MLDCFLLLQGTSGRTLDDTRSVVLRVPGATEADRIPTPQKPLIHIQAMFPELAGESYVFWREEECSSWHYDMRDRISLLRLA